MDLIKSAKRRSLLSETIYIFLNISLAAGMLITIWATGSLWVALILVLLSKWRVFAVRPRYWFAHVESNIVDVIVGVGTVTLIYLVGQVPTSQSVAAQVVITILYALWLLLLKPRTRRSLVAVQSAVAVAVGTMALAGVSYEWPSSVVVLCMWLIGYSTARHVLTSFEEEQGRFLSLVWGFVAAEIGWITYHWTIAYSLPFAGGLKLPQLTLILLGVSFLAERVYESYHKHQVVRYGELLLPIAFVLGIIVALMLFFNAAEIGSV